MTSHEFLQSMLTSYIVSNEELGVEEWNQCLSAVPSEERFDILSTKFEKAHYTTVLHTTTSRGHELYTRAILESVAEEDRNKLLLLKNGQGDTAISVASHYGQTSIVQCMLEAVDDIARYNVLLLPNDDAETVLHVASHNGHFGITANILDSVTKEQRFNLLTLQDRDGNTAMSHAASNGHSLIVQYSMNCVGADVRYNLLKISNGYRRTVLHTAAYYSNDTKTIDIMLDSISSQQRNKMLLLQDNEGDTAISDAAFMGHQEVVQGMLKFVRIGDREELLLKKNKYGQTAVHRAAYNGHAEIIKMLLDCLPAEQQTYLLMPQERIEETPISLAAYRGHSKALELMLKRLPLDDKYSILQVQDDRERTLLHYAVWMGKLKVVETVVESVNSQQQVDLIMIQDRYGDTILSDAVCSGNVQTVCYLLQCLQNSGETYGALATPNDEGETPLHFAVQKSFSEIVGAIIGFSSTSDICNLVVIQDNVGNTAMMNAARTGDIYSVNLMLAKVEANHVLMITKVQNINGETATHIAAKHGHYTIIDTIIRCLPDDQKKLLLDIQNSKTETTEDMAKKYPPRRSLTSENQDVEIDGAPQKPNNLSQTTPLKHKSSLFQPNITLLQGHRFDREVSADNSMVDQPDMEETSQESFPPPLPISGEDNTSLKKGLTTTSGLDNEYQLIQEKIDTKVDDNSFNAAKDCTSQQIPKEKVTTKACDTIEVPVEEFNNITARTEELEAALEIANSTIRALRENLSIPQRRTENEQEVAANEALLRRNSRGDSFANEGSEVEAVASEGNEEAPAQENAGMLQNSLQWLYDVILRLSV